MLSDTEIKIPDQFLPKLSAALLSNLLLSYISSQIIKLCDLLSDMQSEFQTITVFMHARALGDFELTINEYIGRVKGTDAVR